MISQSSASGSRRIKPIAVAVVRREDRYLVGERPAGVPLAGYAEFPGGKIEAGEAPEATAERECLEETGIEIEVTGSLAIVEHTYDHGTLRLHFFAAKVVDESQTASGSFRWVAIDELRSLTFPPANAAILELLGASN